jgi:hypothetical protein
MLLADETLVFAQGTVHGRPPGHRTGAECHTTSPGANVFDLGANAANGGDRRTVLNGLYSRKRPMKTPTDSTINVNRPNLAVLGCMVKSLHPRRRGAKVGGDE